MKSQATAQLNYVRMSPQKLRLTAGLIRGLSVEKAIVQLRFSKKQAARPVLKLLESAVANAVQNNALKRETLVVQSITVDGGPILHRWMPRAMGRATPVRKRSSHIILVLQGEADEKKKVQKAKKDENKTQEPMVEADITEKKTATKVAAVKKQRATTKKV